jgi:hypothetical protein
LLFIDLVLTGLTTGPSIGTWEWQRLWPCPCDCNPESTIRADRWGVIGPDIGEVRVCAPMLPQAMEPDLPEPGECVRCHRPSGPARSAGGPA